MAGRQPCRLAWPCFFLLRSLKWVSLTSDARYPEIPYTPTGGGEDQRGRTSTGLGGGRKHREEAIPKSDRRQERIRLEPGGGLRGGIWMEPVRGPKSASGWSRFGDSGGHLDGAGSGASKAGGETSGWSRFGGRFGQTCSFLSGRPGRRVNEDPSDLRFRGKTNITKKPPP